MRVRFWRLSITEVLNSIPPAEKTNHWDIKCILGEHEHFGVFWFRYGTPFDKEPVHGICFYFNEVPRKIIDDLANELSLRFSAPVELTIEFEKIDKEEIDKESFKLPASKALHITGPD